MRKRIIILYTMLLFLSVGTFTYLNFTDSIDSKLITGNYLDYFNRISQLESWQKRSKYMAAINKLSEISKNYNDGLLTDFEYNSIINIFIENIPDEYHEFIFNSLA